jgi:hypothetical protein
MTHSGPSLAGAPPARYQIAAILVLLLIVSMLAFV